MWRPSKTILHPRKGFMTKEVWTSSLSRLRSLRFSVQSFISYLASKELPDEMQLVYNSSQPSCETSGKTIVPVVSFKFKLEKLRAFSVCCGYYFKLLRMACQWSTDTICILNACMFSCVFLCSLQNQDFLQIDINFHLFGITNFK